MTILSFQREIKVLQGVLFFSLFLEHTQMYLKICLRYKDFVISSRGVYSGHNV